MSHERNGHRPYFFIHLRKTGGTSLRKMLWDLFPQEEIFPNEADERSVTRTYPDVRPETHELTRLTSERLDSIRLLCGHYPLIAGGLLPGEPRCFTMLRHPVERTISHLRHGRTYVPEMRRLSLEEIFDIERVRRVFLDNPQTRAFSFRSIDEVLRVDDPVRMDRQRLEEAKRGLSRCEAVGITERFADSVRLLERTFGWRFERILRENVTRRLARAGEGLRRRIARLVSLDMELYEHARALHRERVAREVRW